MLHHKKTLGFLSLMLLFTVVFQPAVASGEEKPVVIVFAKGMLGTETELGWVMGNITDVEWVVFTETITFSDIEPADVLIPLIVDTGYDFTDDEVNAIKEWWDKGGKSIWISSDSDYPSDAPRIDDANKLLEALGSVLRSEHRETVDPVCNCKKDYRVKGLVKPDHPYEFLAGGAWRGVLFHGPGVVITYVDGKYGKPELEVPENVYRIVMASETASIAEFTEGEPVVHDIGEEGPKVLMAAEVFPDKGNVLVFSASAPFAGTYRGMWLNEYHGVKLDGPGFVGNIILWLAGLFGTRLPPTPAPAPLWTPALIAAVALDVIFAVALIATVAYYKKK